MTATNIAVPFSWSQIQMIRMGLKAREYVCMYDPTNIMTPILDIERKISFLHVQIGDRNELGDTEYWFMKGCFLDAPFIRLTIGKYLNTLTSLIFLHLFTFYWEDLDYSRVPTNANLQLQKTFAPFKFCTVVGFKILTRVIGIFSPVRTIFLSIYIYRC